MSNLALRGVLLDMDGVLYQAERPLLGAKEAVGWLRIQRIPTLFVTNTSSQPRSALVAKLARFGIAAEEDDILIPAVAAAQWLRAETAGPVALFLREAARVDFGSLEQLEDEAERGAAAVVIGDLGSQWDFRTLNRAFRLLHNSPQAPLVALGMTRYWLAADGPSLDVAPFVAALEHATGRKARVFGKPAPGFFATAVRLLALPPEQIMMVGDDIQADVAGAQAVQLKGALVRTGKFRESDLNGEIRPDAILDSIGSLPDWWKEHVASNPEPARRGRG